MPSSAHGTRVAPVPSANVPSCRLTQNHTGGKMGILAWIVLGLIAGAIAKAIMPGNDPGGIIVTMIIGIVGAFIGGFLGNMLTGVGPFRLHHHDPSRDHWSIHRWLAWYPLLRLGHRCRRPV